MNHDRREIHLPQPAGCIACPLVSYGFGTELHRPFIHARALDRIRQTIGELTEGTLADAVNALLRHVEQQSLSKVDIGQAAC